MLDRAQIERVVPHAGAMCLLDEVSSWDATHIACSSAAPTAAHPLARDGSVPAIAACEYAAQAAAVHGALLDGAQAPRPGMLAKLMDIEMHACAFESGGAPVTVRADLESRVATGCLYRFEVRGDQPIASGRFMVAFTEGAPG
ncbi:hydroxymyristoyl-ACP dehydratase [Caenimonas aquaedulcis]|uniref:Hydroxymyristoyl-ACP dehydratase n=1 Tax=Caenimonas aquaedulcis TaxID=2793270 RepID=A0A931MH69_9BURK|nr:hydroxymyristoyl-ACP dehydratase [Caenimonas aquaedulcis]MBG9388459.1 hydroxymyristoyl-ACP dehydratase [Caenimonas aquaedulcis]